MDPFARYPSGTYAAMQDGLIAELAVRQVGRNGLIVMLALCRKVYVDGRLGRAPAAEISRSTGLTLRQVAHGMKDLRDRGVIVPVVRERADGTIAPDRSRLGFVAQYRIAQDVWSSVELL